MKIYLGIISDGCYDDHDTFILYAGTNKELAVEKCKKHKPIFNCSYSAYIQIWENGINIKELEITD